MTRTIDIAKTAVFAAVLTAGLLFGLLGASKAEAKKKLNVVRCDIQTCEGTNGRDRLLGTSDSDEIAGKGGNDVYRGNGDGEDPDSYFDTSLTSGDTYAGLQPSFTAPGSGSPDLVASILDAGGSGDVLDLRFLKLFDDVTFVRDDKVSVPGNPPADDLRLIGPGDNIVLVVDHFGRGRIETIRFSNATVTGTQAASLASETTPREQATLDVPTADYIQPSRVKE